MESKNLKQWELEELNVACAETKTIKAIVHQPNQLNLKTNTKREVKQSKTTLKNLPYTKTYHNKKSSKKINKKSNKTIKELFFTFSKSP